MRALIAISLFACTPSAPPPPVHKPTPPAAPADPSCRTTGAVPPLVAGHLRCAELPFDVAFPSDATISRSDDYPHTLFNAKLDHGVLALVLEPRPIQEATPKDFTPILEAFIRGIAAAATTKRVDAPPLDGATSSIAIEFATPDGGAGVVRGYVAYGWLVVIVAGGRLAETTSRPDKPIGAAFLASLRLHGPVKAIAPFELPSGSKVDLPSTAWLAGGGELQPGERVFILPDEHVFLDLREFDRLDDCEKLRDTKPPALPAAMDQILHGTLVNIQAERAPIGELGIYFQGDNPKADQTAHVAADLVCFKKSIVVVSIAGARASAEMRAIADRIAKSLR